MIKKISTAELKVGMYVEDTGLSWLEHPYLYAEAGEISSVSHVQAILKEGYREAFINTEKGALGRPDDPGADEAVGRELSREEGPPVDLWRRPSTGTRFLLPGSSSRASRPVRISTMTNPPHWWRR
ncbi:MAG: DUF3391 domain-containing protein [Desulfohalobiaceae bacterium]